jgi:transcriptional regulator with XRE-family HTH domain
MSQQPQTIAEQLRAAIDADGRTRYRIALDAQIAHETLSRFYNGERGLSWDALERLAETLGLTLTKAKQPKRSK